MILAYLTLVALSGVFSDVQQDSARIVGDRIVVEPLGVSFGLPRWRDPPPASQLGSLDGCVHDSTIAPAVIGLAMNSTQTRRIGELAAVVDSVMRIRSAVATFDATLFGAICLSDLHVRVYIGDEPQGAIHERAGTVGLRVAERSARPIVKTLSDSASWQWTRLQWPAPTVGEGIGVVEFVSREVRGRSVTFVFMYTNRIAATGAPRPRYMNALGLAQTERDDILSSFRAAIADYIPPVPRAPQCFRFSSDFFWWLNYDEPRSANPSTGRTAILLLDTIPRAANDYAVRPAGFPAKAPATASVYGGSGWSYLEGDSIQVRYSNRFAGPVFRLAVRGDSLVGTVVMKSDVYHSDPVTGRFISPPPSPATAVKNACPREAP